MLSRYGKKMNRYFNITLFTVLGICMASCDQKVDNASIEISTSSQMDDSISVQQFICRGSSPGHLRLLWNFPDFEEYRPGVVLTENSETGLFEAGILIIISPREDGASLVSIRYGTPGDLRNSIEKTVDSDDATMSFHTPRIDSLYNRDMTIGTLGGYDFVVSLDSEPFDYRGSDRIPKVTTLTQQ